MVFNVSGNSNGFFCHLATRDIDKAVVEFLSTQYNLVIKSYNGINTDYLAEKSKLNDIAKWENCNATIKYDVTLYNGDQEYTHTDIVDYIRLNESSAVIFPEQIYSAVGVYDRAQVTIKSITFDKLHFMINHKSELSSVPDIYDILIAPDNRIELGECHIMCFIDEFGYLLSLGNETIVSLVDVPRFNEYMQTFKDTTASSIMFSTDRPEESEWDKASIWAERIRDVAGGGIVTETTAQTRFNDLEEFFSSNNNTGDVTIYGELEFEGDEDMDDSDFIIDTIF